MRIASRRQDDEFELNVISLIDVMLTLLMFFVLTATFEQRSMLQVTLPKASSAEASTIERALLIVIDAQGRYLVDNREVLRQDSGALKSALLAASGGDRSRRVMIRADARTPHQSVVRAMDALGQLGFVQLSIATTPERDGQ